jgi:uncharacterized delta-60 repeat protein
MARRCRPSRLAALFAAAALAAALGATVVTTNSWAAAGILDPTFGSAGTVNTAGQADAREVVLQPDGKLVAAGTSRFGSSWQFGLARYDATGALDLSFGSSGLATTPIGTRSWANALVLQPDGKLVAASLGKGRAITRGKPISGMVPGQSGYMMVAQDGGIFSFGNVAFHGSLGSNPPPKPVASVALQP